MPNKRHRRQDKTSIAGVDFPFLLFRERRKNTRSRIAKTFRIADPYKGELNASCRTLRCYFGFMTTEEADTQQMALQENSYFVYSVYREEMWICCGKTDIMMDTECDSLEEVLRYIDSTVWTPLDRGDGLIFQKKLKKRVRASIMAWSLVAMRLRVVKDIRVMIVKLIWEHKREWVP